MVISTVGEQCETRTGVVGAMMGSEMDGDALPSVSQLGALVLAHPTT
jgi:hypothetical protein